MTSVIRRSIALVSCILLSAGMANAAQLLDQVAAQSPARSAELIKGASAMPSTMPCIVPQNKR